MDHRCLVWHLLRLDEIDLTDLCRIHAHLGCRNIHQPLQQIGRLRPAGTACGIYRRCIGHHSLHFYIDRRCGVLPRQQESVKQGGDGDREQLQVSPHVGMAGYPQGQELAVFVQGHFCLGHMIAAMGIAQEGFRPVTGPFYRAIELLRRPGAYRLFIIGEDFGAEATAHVGRHHAELMLRCDIHKCRHYQPMHMRVLRGQIQRRLVSTRIILADRSPGFHRVGHHTVVDQFYLRYLMGRRKCRIHGRRITKFPVQGQIVRHLFMQQRRAGLVGTRCGNYRRQFGIIHVDQFCAILGLRQSLSNHHSNGIAYETSLVDGQNVTRRHLGNFTAFTRDSHTTDQAADAVVDQILSHEHADHARRRFCGRGVDRVDGRVGMWRANQNRIGLPRSVDIVGVVAFTGQETVVFLALYACANSILSHVSPPWSWRLAAPP